MTDTTEKNSLLVVGSLGHPLAEKCVNWGETFYPGDYDVIVFNTLSLTEDELWLIYSQDPKYFNKIREICVEAQEKGLKIICITNAVVTISSDKIVSNYDWSPIVPIFEEKPGTKIDRSSSNISSPYLAKIEKWERLYSDFYNQTGYQDIETKALELSIRRVNYVVNSIGKAVAFSLVWKVIQYRRDILKESEPILFLPPLEDVSTGINLLLEEYSSQEDSTPGWIESINLPGDEAAKSTIQKIDSEVNSLEEARATALSKLEENSKYKKLLFLKGKPLELVVDKAFSLFGIEVESPKVFNIHDRMFKEGDANVFIEIRGKDNENLKEKDLNQLTSRLQDKPTSDTYTTRGLFVLNHYRNLSPNERKEAFEANIVKKAEVWDCALITTSDLFELVKIALEGKDISGLKNTLFNTKGRFNLQNFIDSIPTPEDINI